MLQTAKRTAFGHLKYIHDQWHTTMRATGAGAPPPPNTDELTVEDAPSILRLSKRCTRNVSFLPQAILCTCQESIIIYCLG